MRINIYPRHWTALVLTIVGAVAAYFHFYFTAGFAWIVAVITLA